MKTKIYFVCHAQPDFSIKQDDIRPLSAKGMEDTKRVTDYLLDKKIAAIYSSAYKRSYDTVKGFAEAVGLPIITIEDFRERSVGMWVEDFKAYAARQWEDFDFKLDNGESLGETQKRNIAALENVLYDHTGESVVIATHGTALATMIHYYRPDFGYRGFWGLIDKMPFIVCIQFEGIRFETLDEVDLFEVC